MPEYIALDPKVEVKGAAVLATLQGIDPELIRPVAEKFGLVDIHSEGWYPQQAWLDTLKTLDQTFVGGALDLVAVGMEIPKTADWPAEVDTFEAALFSIDEAYHMNHRHGEIGHYKAKRINDEQIDVICDNPYPCYFDYGIIYGVALRFGPEVGFTVIHDESTCRKKGDAACVYHVTWHPRE
jgi:hypothetical protein